MYLLENDVQITVEQFRSSIAQSLAIRSELITEKDRKIINELLEKPDEQIEKMILDINGLIRVLKKFIPKLKAKKFREEFKTNTKAVMQREGLGDYIRLNDHNVNQARLAVIEVEKYFHNQGGIADLSGNFWACVGCIIAITFILLFFLVTLTVVGVVVVNLAAGPISLALNATLAGVVAALYGALGTAALAAAVSSCIALKNCS